ATSGTLVLRENPDADVPGCNADDEGENDRGLTATDTKTRSLKPGTACQIEFRLIHVDHFRPRKLPWVAEGQPLFRVLLLPTIPDDLAEQSVIVANAVAIGRNSEARHALHKTGGEPTKAPMAQCRVRLSGSQPV